ncbi:MAG: Lrp/AsnC family transcriptional regulator [Gemmobacter sp.]|nr:Lrp/AsnC family transcriptional regulator [Gemmobacter sp.]
MTDRQKFDGSDRRLARYLSEDGRLSINDLAKRLNMSGPTIRSRLRALIEKGFLRVSGLINLAERPELTMAIVAINTNGHGKLNELAKRLSELPFVTWVGITTGRHDMMAEVVFEGDMEVLYRFTSELLPGLAEPDMIRSSETFVVMKTHGKWVGLPKGVWEDGANPAGSRE